MAQKKGMVVLAVFCMIFILIPIPNTTAYEFQDKVSDTNSLFFLVALDKDKDNNLLVSITHEGEGNFNMFLFNFRPNKTNVNIDRTFNNEIFGAALVYDGSDTPEINYTHSEDKSLIYYLQVVLLDGGPDFFTLQCNLDLVRYYLPSLPGFSIEIMMLSLMISIAVIVIFIKKRRI